MTHLANIGIKTAKLNQFKAKGIETVKDLISFLPRKYFDFTEEVSIRSLEDGQYALISGELKEIKEKGDNFTLTVVGHDGGKVYISFFRQSYLKKQFQKGRTYFFGGKASKKPEFFNTTFFTPVKWSEKKEEVASMEAVYSKIKGMSDSYLKNTLMSAIQVINKNDYLEHSIMNQFNLVPYHRAIRGLHQPQNEDILKEALQRKTFDDLFEYNFHLLSRNKVEKKETPYILNEFSKSAELMKLLPFQLTDDQRSTLRELSIKVKAGERLDALVMGDVGCGKTIVAQFLLLIAAESGYQGAIMCPTNVLALQHYLETKERLEPLGVKVGFLNGGMKVREKKKVLKELKDGEIDVLVGTHAIIGKDVEFKSLAMAVVDEEHRFGVLQREAIREKALDGVHMVSMSATPIPRSFAMTIYGDHVSIHTIKTLPSGRKPVKVTLHEENDTPYLKILEAVKRGEQAYVVCPLIEESDDESASKTMANVKSVEKVYQDLTAQFKHEGVVVDFISGNMKEDEMSLRINEFKEGNTHVLVSTTVIEVGVNVPNSTVMVIENAERFGASQLWQLKGRVGRGDKSSSCFLVSPNPNPTSKEKLEIICNAKDGFEVSKEDLRLRGAGSLLAEQQSGGNKFIELILNHPELNDQIRKEIRTILADEKRVKRYQSYFKEESTEL